MRAEPDVIYELPFKPGERFRVMQAYGGTYSHTGDSYYSIDFRMPEGTTVCAARSGVIYRVIDQFDECGTHPSFKPKGNAIYVLHVDDTIASYVHLLKDGAIVRPGQFVNTGQPIGLSGNTGWSGCPHLHFHVVDGITRERIPTKFNCGKGVPVILQENHLYSRPKSTSPVRSAIINGRRTAESRQEAHGRNAYAFCPELLNCKDGLVAQLSEAGFELASDYSSVDVLHDVYGLEVCGIQNGDNAMQITRLLLGWFSGWNAGWLHAPDNTSQQKWVARIQRDHDDVLEYWDTD